MLQPLYDLGYRLESKETPEAIQLEIVLFLATELTRSPFNFSLKPGTDSNSSLVEILGSRPSIYFALSTESSQSVLSDDLKL